MVARAQTANWLAAILMVAAVGGVASLGEATDYYVSESLGNDAWAGLLPEPDPGPRPMGPKQSPHRPPPRVLQFSFALSRPTRVTG